MEVQSTVEQEKKIFSTQHAEYRFKERVFSDGKSLIEAWEESHEVFVNKEIMRGRVFYHNDLDIFILQRGLEIITIYYADVMDDEDIRCVHGDCYKECPDCNVEGQYLNTSTPKLY